MVNFDYLYNPEYTKKYCGKNFLLDKKLGFHVVEQGIIFPHEPSGMTRSGIVDSNGKCIKNTAFAYGLCEDYTPPPVTRISST